MKKLNTRQNFLNVLVDCRGYSEEEALEEAQEYNNNLKDWILDCGGDNNAVKECRAFLGI